MLTTRDRATRSDRSAWRASTHTTGRPTRLSSCHSQLAIAPVSKPIRSAVGARFLITRANALGSDAALPSNRTVPFSSTTHTAVSFWDTSKPTYCFTAALLLAALLRPRLSDLVSYGEQP